MRYVYFAQAETAAGLDAVKIGVAKNPRQRVRGLQCGNPVRIKLLAFVPGDEHLERRLHMTFDPIGLCGEWFARKGKLDYLLGYLETYAAEEGQDGFVPKAKFEAAICDNVAVPSWMPCGSESEEEHEASANSELWAEYA